MSSRPRGRTSESRGPTVTKGVEAVDEYLVALDDAPSLDARSIAALECGFVRHAKHFADCRGISFAAWLDVGVPLDVLERAGIHQAAVV
jgi:hypothetical protein